MSVAEVKTTKNTASVPEFLAGVADERRRTDAQAVCALMTEVTGLEPAMWGPSIVGFGSYRYEYASGRKGEAPAIGFSPRKDALTVYFSDGFDGYADLLAQLGRVTTSKACLYIKELAEVDAAVLRTMIDKSFQSVNGTTLRT